ncbi:MAG TPA: DUF3455 domain-containing protein [Gemmatimonadaceae bacterium]|nr:DUF3455 domain-containing protein [Gemmatimonadaceae bacterium]
MRRIAPALVLLLSACQVVTQHNDTMRTGANLRERNLTPAAVQTRGMQLVYWRPVTGSMRTQPLYVSNVWSDYRWRDVIYAATEANWIYAYDAGNKGGSGTNQGLLWSRHLPVTANSSLPIEGGIGGTPVIDPATNTMYVVYGIHNGMLPPGGWGDGTFDAEFHLVALNIKTGNVLRDSVIRGSVTSPVAPGVVPFEARHNVQRAAILLTTDPQHPKKKYLWVPFALRWHEESINSHGWVMRYDAATFAPRGVFCTTPDRRAINEGAGIWQGGGGLAADSLGNAYFLTGNGPAGTRSYGNSVVKLVPYQPSAGVYDFHAYSFSAALDDPAHQVQWDNNDIDLGSGGVMVIPRSSRLVGGGKTGFLYLMDISSGVNKVERFAAFTSAYHPTTRYDGWNSGPHLHGSPTYWDVAPDSGFVYHWGEQDSLRRFTFHRPTGLLDTIPSGVGHILALDGLMPGGLISLSANGDHDGVLWATLPGPGTQGRLIAIDATTMQTLWQTTLPSVAHASPATVVASRVIVPTQSGRFDVYELGPGGGSTSDGSSSGGPTIPQPVPIPIFHVPTGDPAPLVNAAMRRLGASAARLSVPVGQRALFAAHDTGVVIYAARPKADGSSRLAWVEVGAEDHLIDDTGMEPNMGFQGLGDTVATHSASSSWRARDGSSIATETVATVVAPDSGAAPWLLMKANSASPAGLFSGVTYAQRIMTGGGWPRRDAATARPGEQVRVPYNARYVFYGKPPGASR